MSRELNSRYAFLDRYTGQAEVSEGGTGANNVVDAATNLGAISESSLNQANGFAQADEDGFLRPENIPTSGLTAIIDLNADTFTVKVGRSIFIRITDYHPGDTIDASVSVGTLSRMRELFIYKAPVTAGEAILTVNTRQYTITVTA